MQFYTVLYTCSRDFPCFRTIKADSAESAGRICEQLTHNFKSLTEVRDYVGQQ